MLVKTLGTGVLFLLLAAGGCERKTGSHNSWAQGSLATLAPGHYDDQDQRVEYKGKWWPDRQFPQSSGQSIT